MLKKMKTETLEQIYKTCEGLTNDTLVAYVTTCVVFVLLHIKVNASRTEWVNLAGGLFFALLFTFGIILISTNIMMNIDIELKDRRAEE